MHTTGQSILGRGGYINDGKAPDALGTASEHRGEAKVPFTNAYGQAYFALIHHALTGNRSLERKRARVTGGDYEFACRSRGGHGIAPSWGEVSGECCCSEHDIDTMAVAMAGPVLTSRHDMLCSYMIG